MKKIQAHSTRAGPENQENSGGIYTKPGRNWEAGWGPHGKPDAAGSTSSLPCPINIRGLYV
ncbi:MAG: hypothetical protein LW693_08450 [Saprospiraceae bacterium]|nr:hypothetical protein [Saprospiraceae bacterium]